MFILQRPAKERGSGYQQEWLAAVSAELRTSDADNLLSQSARMQYHGIRVSTPDPALHGLHTTWISELDVLSYRTLMLLMRSNQQTR